MCGSTKFRLSHFRSEDLRFLAFLRFPVRCRACLQRDHVFLPTLLKIRQDAKLRHRERSKA